MLRPSLLVLGTAAALVGGGSVLAFAGWTSSTVSPTFTIYATPVPQVPKPTVTLIKVATKLDRREPRPRPRLGLGLGLGANPRIQWTKVELTPDEDVSLYIVTRHAGAVAEVVCTLPATRTPICIDKTAPAGNVLTYTVAATYGTNWLGADSEPSPAVTMPGTPVVVTAGGVPVPSTSAAAPSAGVPSVAPSSGASAGAAPSADPVTPTTAPATAAPDTTPTVPEATPTTTEPAPVETTVAPAPQESATP
jgi:hypothetical protein